MIDSFKAVAAALVVPVAGTGLAALPAHAQEDEQTTICFVTFSLQIPYFVDSENRATV